MGLTRKTWPSDDVQREAQHSDGLVTDWLPGPPPCAGIWEVRAEGWEPTRLWWEPYASGGGAWWGFGTKGEVMWPVSNWRHLPDVFEYRGLMMPPQDGYRYAVPGARSYRGVFTA